MNYTDAQFFEFDSSTGTITGYSTDAEAPREVAIPPIIDGRTVRAIGRSAFQYRFELTSVSIPGTVTAIEDLAFEGCYGLASVEIPDSVNFLGAWAFSSCSGLTSVHIPQGITVIERSAFDGCSRLTGALTIPAGVTRINDFAFFKCSGLTSVEIPDSVNFIGNAAFWDCSGLKGELSLPDGIGYIGNSAFADCTGLTAVKIPDKVFTIRPSTFYGCANLASVTIPNGVVSIERYAFADCSKLTGIAIPDSVRFVADLAFEGCPADEIATIRKREPPGDGDMIDFGDAPYGTDSADGMAIKFNYQLLSRMKSDCEYFLGPGNGHRKDLWAGNVADQIKTMRGLYEEVSDKPEWLPEDKIAEYEDQMLTAIRIRAASAASVGDVKEMKECIATGGEKHEQYVVDCSLLSAVNNNRFEMVDWLFEHGASPLAVSDYSLEQAEENGNFEAVQRVRDQLSRHEALYATGSTYEIWQLKDSAEEPSLLFLSYQAVQKRGAVVDQHNYDCQYIGSLEKGTTLDDIFFRFNTDKPGDFKGHSLSVSDVVVLKENGGSSAWYVDPVGFKEVPEFLGKEPLVQKEMPMSQNMER